MRVLLVTPRFREYWRSYEAALEALGHTVRTHRYDDYVTPRERLTNKLLYELPSRLRSTAGARAQRVQQTRDAIAFVDAARADVVVVIKGDTLLPDFWDALDRRSLPSVLYLYDDLHRMAHTDATLSRPRHVLTYARGDAAALRARGHDASYLPLSYDPALPFTPVVQDAVVFVGARYPDRTALLVGLQEHGVPVVAYGRDWSGRPVDRLRSLELRRPPVPGRPDVSLAASYGLAAGAAVAVNMHGSQDGANSRTFEICGAGGLQLADREDVSEFYDVGSEVLVYRSAEELRELAGRALADRAWASGMRAAAQRRSAAEHTCLHRVRVLAEHW